MSHKQATLVILWDSYIFKDKKGCLGQLIIYVARYNNSFNILGKLQHAWLQLYSTAGRL
jgi:hypothetical protein